MTWILILFVHIGAGGGNDSNAITSVPGFKTEAACMKAGKDSKALVSFTVKDLNFVCVAQP